MPTILLLYPPEKLQQSTLDTIKRLAPSHDIWMETKPEEADPRRLSDVEITVGSRPPQSLFERPDFKWHHQTTAGVDWLFEIDGRDSLEFAITNVAGMHISQVSEQAFAMILTFARDMHRFYPAKAKKEWARPRRERLFQLPGKTLLIVGVGAIGAQIAKIGKAHGMQTIGIRRNPDQLVANVDQMFSLQELDTLLPNADIVVSILPHTPGTENAFSAPQFDLMKTTSIFINVGRGIHVNETDLAAAIRANKIAGAGIDAFAKEPLPTDSELWELEDIIITPHTGGIETDYLGHALVFFLENLKRYLAGQSLNQIVDPALAY